MNSAGIRDLMQSPEMMRELEKQAAGIAERGGSDCEVYVAKTRAVAEVRTQNTKDNSLLKAVRG